MKHLFSIFSMLVLVVLSVGCSDNEDKLETYYEPYEQIEQLELVNRHGTLYYGYGISDKWVISTQDLPIGAPTYLLDGPNFLLVINKLPSKHEALKAKSILFSGVIKYLYTKSEQGARPIVYYSLDLKDLKEDNSSRSIQEETECATTFTAPPAWYYDNLSLRSTNRKAYTFDVFVHVIRTSLGVGDYNKETVSQNVINKLNIGFASANIDFNLIGNSYIDSDNYYNFTTSKADALFSENPHDNAIDIYVLSNRNCWSNIEGYSKGLFSTACIVKHNSHNTSTVVHEVAHCLGLYHTHHGTVAEIGSNDNQCKELVDGSNSDVCGDYITDTPADPNSWSISECSYYDTGDKDENGDSYNPDPTNFMSYADEGCRTRFTEGQIDKMHLAIENSIELQGALHGELMGDKNFCSNGIYSIEGLANNETANWTVTKYYPSSTSDDQPLSSQTTTYSGSSITLNASNQSAYYVIQATINGTTTLTKTVTSYAPSPYVGTLAWETTDGQFGVTTNMEHGNTLYISGNTTLSFEYLDQAGNTEANFTCITAANRYLNGSTITLQPADCTSDLRIRTSNSCGTSGNFFNIPCEVTSYYYNLNLNNSTLSIDVEETAKASLASALSIRESDIKTSGDIQSITIRQADGKVIFTKNYAVATKNVRINTSSWPTGEYILEITNGDMTQKRKIRIE